MRARVVLHRAHRPRAPSGRSRWRASASRSSSIHRTDARDGRRLLSAGLERLVRPARDRWPSSACLVAARREPDDGRRRSSAARLAGPPDHRPRGARALADGLLAGRRRRRSSSASRCRSRRPCSARVLAAVARPQADVSIVASLVVDRPGRRAVRLPRWRASSSATSTRRGDPPLVPRLPRPQARRGRGRALRDDRRSSSSCSASGPASTSRSASSTRSASAPDSGPAGLILVRSASSSASFALGTLIYTALAISIAPQVVMFVGLTHATLGLDHVRPGGDRDPDRCRGPASGGSAG